QPPGRGLRHGDRLLALDQSPGEGGGLGVQLVGGRARHGVAGYSSPVTTTGGEEGNPSRVPLPRRGRGEPCQGAPPQERTAMIAMWVKARIKPEQRKRFLEAIEI